MLKDLVLGDDHLSLSINGGPATFDYFWLRDNARDPVSFDSRSHQRELFTASVDPAIRPRAGWVDDGTESLVLEWPDLDMEAHYEAGFLAEFAHAEDPMRLPDPQPWTAASLDSESVRLAFSNFRGEGGVPKLLERLLAHGFTVLTGTPCNLDAVQQVADSMGYVRQTIFGGLFEFEANENMADSAYTPKELRPHTDGTYSHDAPGLQLLLCVDYDADGGESIMVDGARIAADLKDPVAAGAGDIKGAVGCCCDANGAAEQLIFASSHDGRHVATAIDLWNRVVVTICDQQRTVWTHRDTSRVVELRPLAIAVRKTGVVFVLFLDPFAREPRDDAL